DQGWAIPIEEHLRVRHLSAESLLAARRECRAPRRWRGAGLSYYVRYRECHIRAHWEVART
ncbi:MAG: hypothetical protein WD942_10560, partial [Dehalococcoidia bacterium]